MVFFMEKLEFCQFLLFSYYKEKEGKKAVTIEKSMLVYRNMDILKLFYPFDSVDGFLYHG
ncbi:hypothetical protein CWS01_09060 [Niallia nealsonii]|uniref:Uncharacterized protein n=2 Tax=Niallia nealsonii TaxID=115979 RepID=A0A2N0Z319_9BACI|nr:hypothetical protein CWS01_09060 [Niallia nealsonii]